MIRSCQVDDVGAGLAALQLAGVDVGSTAVLVADLLALGDVEYRFDGVPMLGGVPFGWATPADLAVEMEARARFARVQLALGASPSMVLTFLAGPVASTAFLVGIMRPGERFGEVVARAISAGSGHLDAGVWILRGQSC